MCDVSCFPYKRKTRKRFFLFPFVSRKLCRVTSFSFPNEISRKGKVSRNFQENAQLLLTILNFTIVFCVSTVAIAQRYCQWVPLWWKRINNNCHVWKKDFPAINLMLQSLNNEISLSDLIVFVEHYASLCKTRNGEEVIRAVIKVLPECRQLPYVSTQYKSISLNL